MLLDELRKYTPESHVDYDTIRQALELIRDTADTVNNVAKLAEQQRKVRKSSDSLFLLDSKETLVGQTSSSLDSKSAIIRSAFLRPVRSLTFRLLLTHSSDLGR